MALESSPSPTDMPIARFRIERGDTVVGTDGVLGQVEQIVVEREDRQLRSLIMRGADSTEEIELPANHIVRTLEHRVELNIGRGDLTRRPDLAAPYDPNQFVPIFEGPRVTASTAGEVSAESGEPVVTEVESDAAELVSARPEIAPEGEIETVAVTPPSGEPARGEDRVIETSSVVPAAEAAREPGTEFKLPEDKDLMGAEAPPTPAGRQLPPSGQTSPSVASQEQVEEEEFELVEQYEPFFLPENITFREVSLPWKTLMAITGVAVAGATAGFLIWRWRMDVSRRAKRQAILKAGMNAGRWRLTRATRATARETGQRLRETLERARERAEEARANLPLQVRASQRTLLTAAKTPPERLRWFRRGAWAGRTLTKLQMLGARSWGATADSGEMPEMARTRPMALTRAWIIRRPSRVPDMTQTPS